MRLEHRIGIVVCLVVLGVGTWFFMTRDSGTEEPLAAAPDVNPAVSDAPEEGEPALPAQTRRPLADRRTTPRPADRSVPQPEVPSLTLAREAERSTLPGIRSETPLNNETSSVADEPPKPAVSPLTSPPKVESPTTRPAKAVEAPPIGPVAKTTDSTPQVRPTAATPAVQTHVMQKGESISRLAQKYYGSERFVPLILEANKQIQDPRRIPVGAKITIPPAPEAAKPETAEAAVSAAPEQAAPPAVAAAPREQPPGTKPYEVAPDDNWNRIAARVYGSASRWPELFELNKRSPHETPRMLRAGEVIYIPAAATTDTTLMGKSTSP